MIRQWQKVPSFFTFDWWFIRCVYKYSLITPCLYLVYGINIAEIYKTKKKIQNIWYYFLKGFQIIPEFTRGVISNTKLNKTFFTIRLESSKRYFYKRIIKNSIQRNGAVSCWIEKEKEKEKLPQKKEHFRFLIS